MADTGNLSRRKASELWSQWALVPVGSGPGGPRSRWAGSREHHDRHRRCRVRHSALSRWWMSPCAGVRVAQASCPEECSHPPRAFSGPSAFSGSPHSPALRRPMASSAPASDTRARIFERACHSRERSRERVSLLTAKTLRTPPTQQRGHDTRVTSGTRVTRGRGANCLRMEPGACAWSRLPGRGAGCPRMDTGARACTGVHEESQEGRGAPAVQARLAVTSAFPAPGLPRLYTGAPGNTPVSRRLDRWSSSPPRDRSARSSIRTA